MDKENVVKMRAGERRPSKRSGKVKEAASSGAKRRSPGSCAGQGEAKRRMIGVSDYPKPYKREAAPRVYLAQDRRLHREHSVELERWVHPSSSKMSPYLLVPQIDPSVKLYNHGEGPY